MKVSLLMNVSSHRNNLVILTQYDGKKRCAHDSKIVLAKDNQVEPRWTQPKPNTNAQMKTATQQGHIRVKQPAF